MPSELARKLLIVLMLGSLTTTAFFIRLENFKKTPARSIDEVVYARMGKQVLQTGLAGYNTIPYARELTAQGRPLPDYFFQPVFKYPPLFTLLIALSLQIFGTNLLGIGFISLLTGALLIPLTYLLGTLIANRFTGMLAAFLMFMDPVTIICSQKIWPETTLTFFILLSVLLFVWAIKQKKYSLFILSGICCGLAAMTKYPEILLVGAYGLYAAIRKKDLLTNKLFQFGLAIPFLMLIPWILWNVQAYGWKWLPMQISLHSSPLHQKELLLKAGLSLIIITGTCFWLFFRGGRKFVEKHLTPREQTRNPSILFLLGLGFMAILWENFWRGFDFTSLPAAGWSSGMFYYAPATFYFGRLLEFSLIYGFGYAVFFLPAKAINEHVQAIRIVSAVLMLFYVFWGNYQSRYILSSIPFLLVLAAYGVNLTMTKILQQSLAIQRNALLTLLVFVIIYAFVKTSHINASLSFPNNLCYF